MKEMSATMIALIVTGILAVVGFVTVFGIVPFAQNNSAKSDLNNIASAQEMSLALQGHYVGTIADLAVGANGVSTGFVASGGVEHALATNTNGDAYVAVTKSQSGTYFARINGSTTVGEGSDITTALDAAGATTAWASDHGITLPTATAGNGGGQAQTPLTWTVDYASGMSTTGVTFLSTSSGTIGLFAGSVYNGTALTPSNYTTVLPVGATISLSYGTGVNAGKFQITDNPAPAAVVGTITGVTYSLMSDMGGAAHAYNITVDWDLTANDLSIVQAELAASQNGWDPKLYAPPGDTFTVTQ